MLCATFAVLLCLQDPKPAPEPPKTQGLEFVQGDWKVKLYGFVRLDVQYDDSHPNNTQTIGFIRSEDETAPSSIGEPDENSEDLTIHARLTRFGLDVHGPVIERLGARPMGRIEVDFYNNGLAGQSESRAALRMRHAYLKLHWERISFLAGQTTDIISPIFPVVNADLVMWGAGNLGDRRPMILVEGTTDNFVLQAEAGLTGADDNQNLDGGTRDGESSGMPTLQGRLAYRATPFWSEKGKLEIGVWGHRAEEHLDTLPAGLTEDDFDSTAAGFDAVLPLLDFLELRGEGWQGKNLDDVRGGIFQGISSIDGGMEVESRGYWVEAVVKAAPWYTLHVGTSRDNPVNSDVAIPTAGSTAGAEDNRIHYVANRFPLGQGFTAGFDYLRWTTQWRGGFKDGTDNRFNLFFQWNF